MCSPVQGDINNRRRHQGQIPEKEDMTFYGSCTVRTENTNFMICLYVICGPSSSVSIATGYGLDGPGIKFRRRGTRFSAPVQTGRGAHPAFCTMSTGSFPGGKERPGRDADTSPTSSAVGHKTVELYLYSPYGPYGLYRASVPVQ
jgi:hypothetical protein